MPITVVSHAGYRGEETPRRLRIGERSIEVSGIVGCWLELDCRYFKVLGIDGAMYVLRHDAAGSGVWKCAPRQ